MAPYIRELIGVCGCIDRVIVLTVCASAGDDPKTLMPEKRIAEQINPILGKYVRKRIATPSPNEEIISFPDITELILPSSIGKIVTG